MFPLFAGLVSVFLIGRKLGLLDKRNEIIEVKREVEEALEKEEEGDGGARERGWRGICLRSS